MRPFEADEEPVPREVLAEGAQESEQARRDVFRRGEVGREWEVGVEGAQRGRELEEARDRRGVVEIATQSKERAD